MAQNVTLPALGNSMEEGTITQWFKAEGDTVRAGEPLYEVLTDKVTMEVEVPADGILLRIFAPADEIVPVHGVVALLGLAGEELSATLRSDSPTPSPSPINGREESEGIVVFPPSLVPTGEGPGVGESVRLFASPRARRYAAEFGVDIALLAGRGTGIDGRIVEADVIALYEESLAQPKTPRVSPLAQRVADEHDVDLEAVSGSGPDGKVTHDDVRRLIEPESPLIAESEDNPSPTLPQRERESDSENPSLRGRGTPLAPGVGNPAPPELGAGGAVIPLRGVRKMVADTVARSAATAPHVTLTLPVDMTEATRLRQQVLPAIEKSHGVRLSFTDLVAVAAARALLDHPSLNSTFQDNEITLHNAVHLGVAVSLGTDGLIVPVVRDAHSLTLGEFSLSLKALVAKARAGSLTTDEVTGGTFSLTNLGTYGITQFNPIINPPQTAILGVCAIVETVVPINGKPEVRPLMNLCLSFDHRVTDGAPASAFLARVKEILEQPYLLFV